VQWTIYSYSILKVMTYFCFLHFFRLRKNLKSFIIVHPSWFIRTILAITKPFIRYVDWQFFVLF